MNCPFCERAETRPIRFSDEFPRVRGDRDGAKFLVGGLIGQECPDCGEVMLSPGQARQNQDRIDIARAELAP